MDVPLFLFTKRGLVYNYHNAVCLFLILKYIKIYIEKLNNKQYF